MKERGELTRGNGCSKWTVAAAGFKTGNFSQLQTTQEPERQPGDRRAERVRSETHGEEEERQSAAADNAG